MKSLAAALFFLPLSLAYSQCRQEIQISLYKGNDRQIEINIKSDGAFKGEFILLKGIDEKVIGSFSGMGAKSFYFKNLNKDFIYRVIVEFEGEEKFLCKKKVKDIDLTGYR